MTDRELDRDLRADLGALRNALQDVRASDLDEQRLLAAVRVRRDAHQRAAAESARPAVPQTPQRVRAPLALAAAAAFAAVTAMITLRVGPSVSPERPVAAGASDAGAAQATAESAPDGAGAFQPLAFSPGLWADQSYSVVRVRIPVTALVPGYAASPDATIEADLLVGEDGLASGIRFNREDTMFVSSPSNDSGEPR